MMLEIQHRFAQIEEIADIFGIYGSANTRIGLSYGITDKIMIGLGTTRKNILQMASSTTTTKKTPSAFQTKQQPLGSDQSILLKTITDEAGEKVADYISEILNLKAINNINTLLMPSTLSLPSDAVVIDGVRAIVDLKLLNRTRYINKYIKQVHIVTKIKINIK